MKPYRVLAVTVLFVALTLPSVHSGAIGQDVTQCLPATAFPPTGEVEALRRAAEEAQARTASSFTGCPSSQAQALYDQLRANLARLTEIRNSAQSVNRAALASECRNNPPCSASRDPTVEVRCDLLAADLERRWRSLALAINVAITATERAINHLRGLRCRRGFGCSKLGRIVFPKISVKPKQPTNGTQIDLFTQFTPGKFSANFDSGNGQLAPEVRNNLPRLGGKITLAICPDWDTASLLAKLKEQRIVPSTVTPARIRVEIPDTELRVVSRLTQTACGSLVRLCSRLRVDQKVDAGLEDDPLRILARPDCAESIEVGCAQPAFGLTATFSTIRVPDLRRAKVSWTDGTGQGSATVDLSRPEYRPSCNPGPLPSLPFLPEIDTSEAYRDFEFICLEPVLVNLVSRP
jgi:hypothetical protein